MLANGNIGVATLTTGKITEFSPTGAIVREVKMPDTYPTNICFGGADMKTAYITLVGQGSARRHAVADAGPEAQLQLRCAMAGNGQTVIDLDRKRMQAMAAKDIATLESLLADDLIYTHSSARLDTKKSLMVGMTRGRPSTRRSSRPT